MKNEMLRKHVLNRRFEYFLSDLDHLLNDLHTFRGLVISGKRRKAIEFIRDRKYLTDSEIVLFKDRSDFYRIIDERIKEKINEAILNFVEIKKELTNEEPNKKILTALDVFEALNKLCEKSKIECIDETSDGIFIETEDDLIKIKYRDNEYIISSSKNEIRCRDADEVIQNLIALVRC